ncbi:septum formation family protein [Dactylosporangium sp. NPDC048998]|uniref:septum formation family protein n=1 Tax=Dactylosporangium sp. NPDC048998 TaxID=3363976 RepID=UPI003724246E
MRRLALIAIALLLAGTAGCTARPAGTDGDLTNDWAMLPAAKVPEPVVGECHNSGGYHTYDVSAFDGVAPPVPCDQPHQLEVVAVGQLPAELAKAAKLPGRDQFASLFPDCEQAAAQYLGGDWQAGRVYLYLQPPTYAQWLGGARFYRCDAVATGSDSHQIVTYDKTFKDAVRPGGGLAQGCGTTAGGTKDTFFETVEPTPCDQPHDMEFAGYVTAPATAAWPDNEKTNDDLFGKACEAKMLAYTGMSRAWYNRQRDVYYIWWRPSGRTGWKAGEHSSRCFFLLHNRKLSRSVKGIGDAPL